MTDNKKKILVVDAPRSWSRVKSLLEKELACEIDIFDQARLARNAFSKNGPYSLAVIDPYNWTKALSPVQARIDFIKELNGKLPILIFTRISSNALERRYKLVLGIDYQDYILKKYGYENRLLDGMRGLIGE